MRMLWTLVLVTAACNGKEGDPVPTQTCDDYVTTPRADVAVPDWPTGLSEAIAELQNLPGYWYATCGEQFTVNVVSVDDAVQIIDEGLDSDVVCDGFGDPLFGHDNELTPIGFSTMSVVILDHPSGAFGTETIDMDLTLFDGSDGLVIRGTTQYLVPPRLVDEGVPYEDVRVFIRVEPTGMSGLFQLIGPENEDECVATDWQKFQ